MARCLGFENVNEFWLRARNELAKKLGMKLNERKQFVSYNYAQFFLYDNSDIVFFFDLGERG